MPKIDAPDQIDYYKAIFKGRHGTGKSIAAASFPGCYIFDIDGRIASVRNFWAKKRGKVDISYDTYRGNFKTFDEKLDMLLSYNPFDTIIIDTLTAFVDLVLGEVKTQKAEMAKELKGDKRFKDRRFVGGIEVQTISNFGAEASALDDLMDWIRQMKCNVILVAHLIVVEITDLEGNTHMERQLFTGGKKIAVKLPGYFNEGYHFEAGAPYQDDNKQWVADYQMTTKTVGADWAKTVLDIPMTVSIKDGDLYNILKPKMINAGYYVKEAVATK